MEYEYFSFSSQAQYVGFSRAGFKSGVARRLDSIGYFPAYFDYLYFSSLISIYRIHKILIEFTYGQKRSDPMRGSGHI
jgi:hypothetical protein